MRSISWGVLSSILSLVPAAVSSAAEFTVAAPTGMVTGVVTLQAATTDPAVEWVRWELGGWAKSTPKPFVLQLDVGPIPRTRLVRAVALDRSRQPRHHADVVLNRGGRGLEVAFVEPAFERVVSGPTEVVVRASAPLDDAIDTVILESEGHEQPLSGEGALWKGVVDLPRAASALVARVKTTRGREMEKTMVVNATGLVSSASACVVDQTVGVHKGGRPIEGLLATDFRVTDERGSCEVRAVERVRDLPVALGFAIDASLSLAVSRPFLKAAARQLVEQDFHHDDAGFVLAFGPIVTQVVPWTRDVQALQSSFDALPEWTVPGTQLYQAIIESLYQFQGSQGARALVLFTDGNEFEGDVDEADALAYARESGVKIYALAVPPGLSSNPVSRPNLEEANLAALERFAHATGGKAFGVRRLGDLTTIFETIRQDLRAQYLVSYVSHAKRENVFHPVTVKTSHGEVRTAAGFFF